MLHYLCHLMAKGMIMIKRNFIYISGCLSLLLMLSVQSYGNTQYNVSRFCIGLYGSGIKMILGEIDQSTIDQWAGIQLRYVVNPRFTFGFTTAYGWVYPRKPDGSPFESNGQFKTFLIPIELTTRFYMAKDARVLPYLAFSVGAANWDVRDISNEEKSFLARGVSLKNSKFSGTLMGGIGFEAFITNSFAINFNINYHHLLKGDEDTIGTGDDNRGIAEVRAGISIYFGGYKDTDGDGIEDKYDKSPLSPEDFDGYNDNDGIPDYDNDGDGIPDKRDRAPNDPEDFDGFKDQDGVPDPDNDKDGIPDKKDKCPDAAEDFDGFQDEDGCPDPDNDKDGIPDEKDGCPNRPETFNGFEDEDGCPDEPPEPEAPKPKIIEKKVPVILKGIEFRSGSFELLPESTETLMKLYQILKYDPEAVIEIRGYTDNVGSAISNLRLSQRRAEAVMNFLLIRRVAPGRIRAIGKGEADPIAPNTTAWGRRKNRRIEFIRIR